MEEKAATGARAAILNDSGDITVMQKEQCQSSFFKRYSNQHQIRPRSAGSPERRLLYSIKWALLIDGELPSICRLEDPILLTGSTVVM
jgi:hypothetical protein